MRVRTSAPAKMWTSGGGRGWRCVFAAVDGRAAMRVHGGYAASHEDTWILVRVACADDVLTRRSRRLPQVVASSTRPLTDGSLMVSLDCAALCSVV